VLDGGLGSDGGGLRLDEADGEAGRLGFDVFLAERLLGALARSVSRADTSAPWRPRTGFSRCVLDASQRMPSAERTTPFQNL
jgi:hypothetical protein